MLSCLFSPSNHLKPIFCLRWEESLKQSEPLCMAHKWEKAGYPGKWPHLRHLHTRVGTTCFTTRGKMGRCHHTCCHIPAKASLTWVAWQWSSSDDCRFWWDLLMRKPPLGLPCFHPTLGSAAALIYSLLLINSKGSQWGALRRLLGSSSHQPPCQHDQWPGKGDTKMERSRLPI